MKSFRNLLLLCLGLCFYTGAYAAPEPLKIGVVISLTGPFVEDGAQKKQGIELYLAEHNNMIAGHPVEILYKDDGGIDPALAKRQTTELVLRDKVNVLAGYTVTGSLLASTPISTGAKVPVVSMVPDFPKILASAPYLIRVSEDLIQSPRALARWASKNKLNKVYTLVSDFSVGHDVEKEFRQEYEKNGGTIVGAGRIPFSSIDHSPYVQRVKESGADAVFIMVANGQPAINLFKAIDERGLKDVGIKVVATGGVTGEHALNAIGDAAIGAITAFNYSEAHDSPENKKFVEAFEKKYPNARPSFNAVAGYDGMHLIDLVLQKSNGKTDAESFINAAKGISWESPRGPVRIDPETRNMEQREYYREVKKVNGVLQNVEFGQATPGPKL